MEYDAAGRLVRVRDGYGNQLAAYTYGASNQRLISEEGGQRTYYAATGGSVLAEYTEAISSSSPAWRQSYVYLGGRLLATVEQNGGAERTQYHHPDRLGTRLTTNQHDTTTSEQATLPFGTVLSTETSSAPSTSRRFTSYDRSAVTRLDYAVNRHYDPLQGRFTTVDPIGMSSVSLSDPQTLNLYAYCVNDPVNQIDPSGLGFFSFFKKIFGAIGKVIGKIMKWAAAVVGVLSIIAGFAFGMPGLVIMGALLLAYAFGGPTVRRILSVAGAVTSVFAGGGGVFGRGSPGGTGVFNPGAASGVGGVNNFIFGFQAEDRFGVPMATRGLISESITVSGRIGIFGRIGRAIQRGFFYGFTWFANRDVIAIRFWNIVNTGPDVRGGTVVLIGPITNPGGLGGAISTGRAGHDAFVKHVLERGEFAGLGIRTRAQYAEFVNNIQRNATGANVRHLSGGRTAYWDVATGTVVIRNPAVSDLGTAFRPTTGRQHFDTLH